uniref:SFRICE_002763 n=1 Tax=Spodoptera frugiperda TaxID=7108 RepID=A0A2H1VLN0_SPOFR
MVPILFILGLTVVAALPNGIYLRRAPGPRYQHVQDGLGRLHLVDLWQPATDFNARYYPDTENVYHLFTRLNPSVSQPIVPGNEQLLKASNFDASRRTAVLIHGWLDNATGNFNAVLLAAFLAAEDMNVIVVDWSAGSSTFNFNQVRENTVLSGGAVARVISWINSVTGADLADYHIAGYSLGGQQAGMAGRNLGGKVGYITGLDPAGGPGFVGFEHTFRASDAVYTEVMHTNVGGAGYLEPLAQVDFYPNGGDNMPGCASNSCNHDRCFHYFAESIRDGGFTGVKCESYKHALVGDCHLPETLNMGGLEPKTGKTGVYYLETNAASPFSKG